MEAADEVHRGCYRGGELNDPVDVHNALAFWSLIFFSSDPSRPAHVVRNLMVVREKQAKVEWGGWSVVTNHSSA